MINSISKLNVHPVPCLIFKEELYPQYRDELIQYFREYYEFCRDELGVPADAEEVTDAKADYKAIISKPIEECTGIIADALFLMYDSVNGEFEKYYKDDESALLLCRNLIEVNYETEGDGMSCNIIKLHEKGIKKEQSHRLPSKQ